MHQDDVVDIFFKYWCHALYLLNNRLTTTKVVSIYFGLINQQYTVYYNSPVSGLERMITGSVVSALSITSHK